MAYKSTLVKKQMSTPLATKPSRAAKPLQINRSPSVPMAKFPKRSSELKLASNNTSLSTSSSKSFFVNRMVPRDLEISTTFESPEWTEKTIMEKNQWISQFLNKTKADVGFVLKHFTDLLMDGDQNMKDDTYELLSMPGINPVNSAADNCLRAIRLKLLEDKCVRFSAELESKEQMIKDQSEKLNKETRSQETQTFEINIEELKQNLSNVSNQNTLLRLELNSSEELIENLQRDLTAKSDDLTRVSAENVSLNSKLESLSKTFEEMKIQNLKHITRIESLQTEKNKFKQGFFEVQKQRDEYYESWMEAKYKYEETSEKLKKLISKSDAIRKDEIHRSMVESDLIDKTQLLEKEICKKEEETAKMKLAVEQLEKSVEIYKEVDEKQLTTIKQLKANVKEMETRAQCWINRNVRDNFESKIDHLQQLVEKLKTDKKLLYNEYQKTIAENSEKIAKNDKYVERLQSHLNEQQKLINLMRKVKFNPTKFEQTSFMNSIFLKFEDEQRMRQDLERLIQENYNLQKKNVEYKKVFDSHPFKQLFVTY